MNPDSYECPASSKDFDKPKMGRKFRLGNKSYAVFERATRFKRSVKPEIGFCSSQIMNNAEYVYVIVNNVV